MKKLKTVLIINALSSGVTGLGLIFASGMIAQLFGVTVEMPFIQVGIFLVAFATMVLFIGRGEVQNGNAVRFIIILDLLWVATSFAVVSLQLFDLSHLGYLLIIAVALWVAVMAYLQFSGLRQINTTK